MSTCRKVVVAAMFVAVLGGVTTGTVYALQAQNPGPGAQSTEVEPTQEVEIMSAARTYRTLNGSGTTRAEAVLAVDQAFRGAGQESEDAELYRKQLFTPDLSGGQRKMVGLNSLAKEQSLMTP